MTTVACVCRSGGPFGPTHPSALYAAFMETSQDLIDEFVCLTDLQDVHHQFDGVDNARVVWLEHDTPGWWGKVELFRPELFAAGERVVYLDIDIVVTGRMDKLLDDARDDFLASRGPRFGNLASGIMSWTHGYHGRGILSAYNEGPQRVRETYDGRTHRRSGGTHGDQGFIADQLRREGTSWVAAESVQPGMVRYRFDPRLEQYRGTTRVPGDVRLVVLGSKRMQPHEFWPELWLWPFNPAGERDR